jgi:hypothetical protein
MAVQIDKEALIKHHFWILSGCFLLLVLIPLILLGTSVSKTVAEEGKKLDESKKSLKGINNPKNEKWVNAYKKQDEYVKVKKNEVWKDSWETQKYMMTWPVTESGQVQFAEKYKYMGDPINDYDAEVFRSVYNDQVGPVVWLVQPVEGPNKGAVQFKGNWNQVLNLNRTFDNNPPPSTEDIWLAQEDLWVKRELLRIIRMANDSVAIFTEVLPPAPPAPPPAKPAPAVEPAADKDKKDSKAEAAPEKAKPVAKPTPPPAPQSDPFHKVFRNPNWQVDLTLARNAKNKWVLRGKITNISKRKQSLGIDFNVYLDDQGASPALITVDGPQLAAGESTVIPEQAVAEQLTVKQLFALEQVLTWRTAPVKRLDDLRLDYPSSRTVTLGLKKPAWVEKAAAAADSGGGASGGNEPPDAVKKFGGPMGGMGGTMPGSSSGGEFTKNGLPLNRYTDTAEAVRHMPVGMVVIVEEEHIPEFLGAFANSILRIQTLQCHWHHTKEKIKPTATDSSSGPAPVAGGGKPQPAGGFPGLPGMPPGGRGGNKFSGMMGAGGAGGMGMGMGMGMGGAGGRNPMLSMLGGGQGVRAPGGLPGGMGGFNPLAGGEEEEEAETNLVELAVYGLASLYERYPPKDQAVAAAPTATK